MARTIANAAPVIACRRFASFPWYDLPEMHAANDALWQALAGELRAAGVDDVPEALDRTSSHTCDHGPACLFTQTCGYPLLATARDRFTVLAVPMYGASGCSGFEHRSYIVVRASSPVRHACELRDTCFAINEADSNSGMNLPRLFFAPLAREGRFFAHTVLTGSHAASAALVAGGGADAAAIDCVTFALLERYRPAAVRDLRVIDRTPASPTPPLVTSRQTPPATVAALRRALLAVAREQRYAEIRAALFLEDIAITDESAYQLVLDYEREAAQLGYPDLR